MAEGASAKERARWVALFVPVLVICAAVGALTIGSPAGAAPRLANSSTCPTEAYTGATVGNCGSTTTTTRGSGPAHLHTVAGPRYANGRLTWEICGYPAAATGDTIVLYIGGQTEQGWTTTVQRNGCASFSVPWCPSAGTYTVAAVDQTHSNVPEATGSVTVSSGAACDKSAEASGHGGALAFTGANILWVLVAAFVAIVLGYMIVKSNRHRRRAE